MRRLCFARLRTIATTGMETVDLVSDGNTSGNRVTGIHRNSISMVADTSLFHPSAPSTEDTPQNLHFHRFDRNPRKTGPPDKPPLARRLASSPFCLQPPPFRIAGKEKRQIATTFPCPSYSHRGIGRRSEEKHLDAIATLAPVGVRVGR